MTQGARTAGSHEPARLVRAGGPAEVVVALTESEYDTRLRAAAGDASAWDLLVGHYVELVWSWSVAQTGDAEEAAGVCEVVWLRLADALPGVDHEPLPSWLRGAVAAEAGRLRQRRTIPAPRPAQQGAPPITAPPGVRALPALG